MTIQEHKDRDSQRAADQHRARARVIRPLPQTSSMVGETAARQGDPGSTYAVDSYADGHYAVQIPHDRQGTRIRVSGPHPTFHAAQQAAANRCEVFFRRAVE